MKTRHIETWAALRNDAARLLDRYLVDLASTSEKLAVELDAEPELGVEVEFGQWPTLGLRRATWHHHGVADLSVVLEWERPRLLKPGRNKWPFVAVRLPRSHEDPQRRRQDTEAVAPFHAELKGGRKEIVWPYYRYVLPPADAPALDPAA